MTEDGLQQAIYVNIKPEYSTHDKARISSTAQQSPHRGRIAWGNRSSIWQHGHPHQHTRSDSEGCLAYLPPRLVCHCAGGLHAVSKCALDFILLLCIGNALIWTF